MVISLTNCRSTFVIKLGNLCNLEQQRDLKSNKKYNPNAVFLKLKFAF